MNAEASQYHKYTQKFYTFSGNIHGANIIKKKRRVALISKRGEQLENQTTHNITTLKLE